MISSGGHYSPDQSSHPDEDDWEFPVRRGELALKIKDLGIVRQVARLFTAHRVAEARRIVANQSSAIEWRKVFTTFDCLEIRY